MATTLRRSGASSKLVKAAGLWTSMAWRVYVAPDGAEVEALASSSEDSGSE
jgi:hypothetical protein